MQVIEDLKEKGLFRGKANNPMRLGLCSRSKDVIEPLIKPQWWVDCAQMAADSCEVVRNGTLEIKPPVFEATWFRWCVCESESCEVRICEQCCELVTHREEGESSSSAVAVASFQLRVTLCRGSSAVLVVTTTSGLPQAEGTVVRRDSHLLRGDG